MTNEAQEFYRLFTQTSVISFPEKSVDGNNSFITFTMSTPIMAIFIQSKKEKMYWINLRY